MYLFVSEVPSLTKETIFSKLKKRIELHKLPDEIHFLTEIPKTARFKVDKKRLQQIALEVEDSVW